MAGFEMDVKADRVILTDESGIGTSLTHVLVKSQHCVLPTCGCSKVPSDCSLLPGTKIGVASIPLTLIAENEEKEVAMKVGLYSSAAVALLSTYAMGNTYSIHYIGELTCFNDTVGLPVQIQGTKKVGAKKKSLTPDPASADQTQPSSTKSGQVEASATPSGELPQDVSLSGRRDKQGALCACR